MFECGQISKDYLGVAKGVAKILKRKDSDEFYECIVSQSADKKRLTITVKTEAALGWYQGHVAALAYLNDVFEQYEEFDPESPH